MTISLGSHELHWRTALRKHGVCKEIDASQLYQHAGMANPGGLYCIIWTIAVLPTPQHDKRILPVLWDGSQKGDASDCSLIVRLIHKDLYEI